MDNQSAALRHRITQLPDEELLRIVNTDRAQYRDEAILYAEAEIQGRGLRIEATGADEVGYDQSGDNRQNYSQGGEVMDRAEESLASVVQFRMFRGVLSSWESLFSEAAAFATQAGPAKLISISQSADGYDGVVTVWYWS